MAIREFKLEGSFDPEDTQPFVLFRVFRGLISFPYASVQYLLRSEKPRMHFEVEFAPR